MFPRKKTLLLISLVAVAAAQQARRVDDAALKNAAQSGEEWLTYGRNHSETRYSPLNQINTGNVSRLGLAWSYDLGQGGGGQEATPLVWNGTLYGITNWSVIFAVDARTGKERWRWDPEVNQAAVRPKVCCGVVNRGLALYQGTDHRPDYRWPAGRRSMPRPARWFGKRAWRIPRTTTPSPWPRASPRVK